MKIDWNKIKSKIIVIGVVYIIFLIGVVGTFLVTKSGQEGSFISNLPTFTEEFSKNLINPFNTMGKIFSDKELLSSFINSGIFFLVVFIALFFYAEYKSRQKYEYEGTEHGSSDWSKNGEEFIKTPDGKEIINKSEGFILSKNHYLGTDLRKVAINKNILVFGGSGTGKTACFIKPNIMQMLGSYVITDPKGELFRDTSEFLKANGYEVKAFNLVDPTYSNYYNPLAHIRDYSDVDIIAHTIVKGAEAGTKNNDPFWDDTAKMLLKACIYYVISVLPEEERNLSSCLNIVRAGGGDETIFDKLFVGELMPNHPGRKEYESLRVAADKTKQSIAISLASKLSHFDSPNIQRITASNDIDFEDLGKKKMALYVISPDSTSTYNYILTILYGQLMQRVYAQADRNGGTLDKQVYLLLDEFANIGGIPDFNQKLSTSRSRGISMSIIVQSLDQLVDLYKELHENILANCDTQLFLGSQSIKTCEYFSKSLGQKTIKYDSKSKSFDKETKKKSTSLNEQRQGRELMTIDELKRLPMDEEVIVVRGLKPIKAKKAWYFKFHPRREEISRYAIKDLSEMPGIEDREARVMDVEEHLNNLKNISKERIKDSLESKEEISFADDILNTASNNNSSNNNSNSEDNFVRDSSKEVKIDLQKELEKKFDELFGADDI